jgi:hypothetical protein
MGEALVINRLRHVDVAAKIVAALDLLPIVRGRQDHHRRAPQMLARLQPPQYVHAGHIRQVEVEQDEKGAARVTRTPAIFGEQVSQSAGAIGERHDFISNAGPANVLFDETGVALVIFNHDDRDMLGHVVFSRRGSSGPRGNVTVNVLPWPGSD